MSKLKYAAMSGICLTLCCKAACTPAAETCVWTTLYSAVVTWLGTIGQVGG